MPLTKVGTPSGANPVPQGSGKQAGMIGAARAANVVHAKHPALVGKKRMGKTATKRVQSSGVGKVMPPRKKHRYVQNSTRSWFRQAQILGAPRRAEATGVPLPGPAATTT